MFCVPKFGILGFAGFDLVVSWVLGFPGFVVCWFVGLICGLLVCWFSCGFPYLLVFLCAVICLELAFC